MSEPRHLEMRQERTQSADSSHSTRNRCMAHYSGRHASLVQCGHFAPGAKTKWLTRKSEMATSSNHNGGETFKVAVESILQRSIKEINYEGEETYDE